MQDAPFSGRLEHTSSVIDGAIIVIGGFGEDFRIIYNEVWKSKNKGQSWTQMQDAPFSGCTDHTSSIID